MKSIVTTLVFFLSAQLALSQVIDMVNAPQNPIGFKHKKEHFNLKGDIYSSSGKKFDRNGNLIYNFGTRYYYDANGRITGNNYNDSITNDNRGNVIAYKYKNGSITNYRFNNDNLLVFQRNSYGNEKTYTYDSQNRLINTVINRKGVFYQARDYTYNKSRDTLIVKIQYTEPDKTLSFKAEYYYLNGHLVKEKLASGTLKYTITIDNKGNKVDSYLINNANAKHYKIVNRYYSNINSNDVLELGYYTIDKKISDKKYQAVFVNGEKDASFEISKGIKPNEKVIYDELSNTYYSVTNVTPDSHTVNTKLPITTVIASGKQHISYAYDGKFINYVFGSNSVKDRAFNFLGPHMIDYRTNKNIARTYIVNNYKNLNDKAVKTLSLFTTDTTSIIYTRELKTENFYVVVKGKHIDYKKARFQYLNSEDIVVFIEDKPLYILNGFSNAKTYEVLKGSLYNGELKNKTTNNVSSTTTATDASALKCTKGDCKNGWGRVQINGIITDATFKDSAIDGVAYITYPNGSYYHGQYKNNNRHGVGYYKWTNGNIYIGGWKTGKQHGLGYTMNTKNEITSAGLFVEGKLTEEAAQNYKAGKTSGKCMGDCINGFGKFSYSNGDRYWGFFKNGERFGVGTYLWKNKSTYTGAYVLGGKRNGYGIYTYVDKSVFKGLFIDDKIDGLGVMKYAKSGDISQGVFNNNGAKTKDY